MLVTVKSQINCKEAEVFSLLYYRSLLTLNPFFVFLQPEK